MAASSGPRNTPDVRNIFAPKSRGGGSKQPLKNMRSYTPKMLSEDSGSSYFDKQIEIVSIEKPSSKKQPEKALLIGDVTSPMAILNVNQTDDVISRSPTSSPMGFSTRNGDAIDGDRSTKNPLFGMSDSTERQISSPKLNGDLRAPPRVNKFQMNSPREDNTTDKHIHVTDDNNNRSPISDHRNAVDSNGVSRNGLPWIPPVDYDESEATLDFDEDLDEPEAVDFVVRKRDPNISEYGGEDFGKYMPDDEVDDNKYSEYTWRKNIRHHITPNDRKSQTEVTRTKKEKKTIGTIFKNKKSMPQPSGQSNTIGHSDRKSIRHFSSDDAKISGYVKKPGKYIYVKKGPAPLPPNHIEPSDYERFLINRRGKEAMVDYSREGRENQAYIPDDVSQVSGKSNSTWRRFTSKFRKHEHHHSDIHVEVR